MTIDLRSDTVTQPSEAMREAMARAPVGDDVYGEDPSAKALEARAAEVLGKPAALFVSSGTMGNQVALMLHCRPGDDVIIGEHAHCKLYESGAGGAIAGVQFTVAGSGGLFDADELEAAMVPAAAYYMPRTRLVTVENTHNRAGGVVWDPADAEAVAERARSLGLGVHLDGARIWNAAAALGRPVAELCAPFDTVSVCLSKGLGAPVGSILAGSARRITEARRYRKMLGGAMRQVGILCAGGLYALEHNRERVAEDHANARRFAEAIAEVPGISVELERTQTNIVLFEVAGTAGSSAAGSSAAGSSPAGASAAAFVAAMAERGVLLSPFGPGTIRAVTHLDVSATDVLAAAAAVREVMAA